MLARYWTISKCPNVFAVPRGVSDDDVVLLLGLILAWPSSTRNLKICTVSISGREREDRGERTQDRGEGEERKEREKEREKEKEKERREREKDREKERRIERKRKRGEKKDYLTTSRCPPWEAT